MGNFEKALVLNKKCYELRVENLGISNGEHLSSLNRIALNYRDLE